MDNTNNGTNPAPADPAGAPAPVADPSAGGSLGWTPPTPEPAAPIAEPAAPVADPAGAPAGGVPAPEPTNSWTPEPSTPPQPADPVAPAADPAVGGEAPAPAAPVDSGTGTGQPAA